MLLEMENYLNLKNDTDYNDLDIFKVKDRANLFDGDKDGLKSVKDSDKLTHNDEFIKKHVTQKKEQDDKHFEPISFDDLFNEDF